jgi:hypothetical protein
VHRLRKLRELVPDRCYTLGESKSPSFTLALPAHGRVTAAFTWTPPREAKPGDWYRLDVVQRRPKQVVGGSTYFFAVVGGAAPS